MFFAGAIGSIKGSKEVRKMNLGGRMSELSKFEGIRKKCQGVPLRRSVLYTPGTGFKKDYLPLL